MLAGATLFGAAAGSVSAAPLAPGSPLPAEFKVEGWILGGPVAPAGLKGKVVVVEAWAFW
jgi:hypothetical protein